VSAPLNLARRPFRNERLPTAVLALGCLVLAIATVRHALLARDLLPGRSRDVMSQVRALEKELGELRAETAQLGQLAAPPESLKEWAAVKGLVDHRAFSWTGLFAALEEAVPPGVRLVSVSPRRGEGRMELSLVAVGRQGTDALALFRALQSHADFEGAFLNGWTEGRAGVDITCSVRYAPKPRPRRQP
jgi:Tfp pilus assembly protein PilN